MSFTTSPTSMNTWLKRLGPVLGLFFVVALFSVLAPEKFATGGNLQLILLQTAVVGTAALGMTMVIISGGIDLYLDPLLRRWGFPGLKRFRAKATRATAGLRLDYRYLRGATLAEFKRSRVLHHRRRGRRVLFAGDGTSDLPAAQAADLAFARGHLLRRCRSRGVPARPLDTFAAPRKALSCSPR